MNRTYGPWRWKRTRDGWMLVGPEPREQVVLDVCEGGPLIGQLRVRSADDVMVRFDPKHPDAAAIAEAPELLMLVIEMRAMLKKHLVMDKNPMGIMDRTAIAIHRCGVKP